MIRRAMFNDVPELAKLFDAYRVFYQKPSDISGAVKFLSERIKKDESVIYIIDHREGGIIGFVQCYPIFSSTRMQRFWLLNDLYVHPEWRGKGMSKLLMEAAQELARDTSAAGLILETAKNNIPGNALYPKMGFTLDTEHNYYTWDTN